MPRAQPSVGEGGPNSIANRKGPRRSRNILISSLSGPAAAAFPISTKITGLYQSTTGKLGLKFRCLRTKCSQTPIALVLIGKTSATPPSIEEHNTNMTSSSSSTSILQTDLQSWNSLNELFGWQIDQINGILVAPPTPLRFLEILRTIAVTTEITLTLSHRPTDVVDVLYKSR